MLGASTLYHRVNWSARMRPWMRRADHVGIYALIAGSYTPVGLLVMHGAVQVIVLAVVWGGAAAAAVFKLCSLRGPTWVSAAIGLALGWVGIAAMPQVLRSAGSAAFVLLAAGGIAYSLGGIVYALRRPDPVPAVFGYHELFHALTIVALALQYVAISFFVVRVG
jgi:hemolysin III